MGFVDAWKFRKSCKQRSRLEHTAGPADAWSWIFANSRFVGDTAGASVITKPVVPYILNIATVSYTSNRPRNDSGNKLGLCIN